MKVASSASPLGGLATEDPATTSVALAAKVDRRPGSSRVRRPPKRLLSPPPPPRQHRQLGSASSSPVPPPSATTTPSSSSTQSLANAAAVKTSENTMPTPKQPPSSRSGMNPSRTSSPNGAMKDDGIQTISKRTSSASNGALRKSKGKSPIDVGDSQAAVTACTNEEDLITGPGKRKRKPSTLSRPPSTITVATAPSSVGASSMGSSSRDSSGGASMPKSRASPSRSGPPAAESGGRIRIKVRHSAASSLVKRPSLPCVYENASGYDSDEERTRSMRAEGAVSCINAKLRTPKDDGMDADEEGEADDVDHLAAPPFLYQRSHSAHPSNGKSTSPMTVAAAPTSNGSKRGSQAKLSIITPVIPPRQGLVNKHRSGGHTRTKSMPSISTQALPCVVRFHRSSLEAADPGNASGAETTDAEDEDDFHREMMEGGFDAFDLASDWIAKSCDVDTPATTPRSPQSTCDHLSDHQDADFSGKASLRSSSDPEVARAGPPMTDATDSDSSGSKAARINSPLKTEGSMPVSQSAKGRVSDVSRDSVFAHALPPSSRRTQTHAGLLTLSLPYDESKVYSSPISKAGVTTPTLERRANGVCETRIKEEEEEEESASRQLLLLLQDTAGTRRDCRSNPDDHDVTTSPPLSPTQALLKNGSSRSNPLNLPGTTSMTSSPFLSAVHHQGSSMSRPSTPPVGFNLPPSIVARKESPAASPVSTRQDLHDVSPFPVEDEDELAEGTLKRKGSSPLRDKEDLDEDIGADTPSHLSAFSPEVRTADMRDPLFSLPETMDLDDIDVAYGGNGRAAILGSSQVRHAVMVSSGQSISLRAEGLVNGDVEMVSQKQQAVGVTGGIFIDEDQTNSYTSSKGRHRGGKRSSDVFEKQSEVQGDRAEMQSTPARKSRKVTWKASSAADASEGGSVPVSPAEARPAFKDKENTLTTPARRKSGRGVERQTASEGEALERGSASACKTRSIVDEDTKDGKESNDEEDEDDEAEEAEGEKRQPATPTQRATRRGIKSPALVSTTKKGEAKIGTKATLPARITASSGGKVATGLRRTRSRKEA